MRLILELLIVAALIGLAWETPYRETVGNVVPWVAKSATIKRATHPDAAVAQMTPTPTPRSVVTHRPPVTTPAPTVSGAWMWEKKGALDSRSPAASQPRRP